MAFNKYMRTKHRLRSDSGQVGIIVLLIMVVMTTVGVSVASRSVSELKLSRQEEQSTRALDLAEGGAEKIIADIGTYSGVGTVTVGSESVNYNVTAKNEITDMTVFEGHTIQVDLGNVATDLQVTWDNTGSCDDNPAIVVALISDAANVRRLFYGPEDCSSVRSDGSTNVALDGSTNTYTTGSIPLATERMARIKVLYGPANVSVTGADLPPQVDVVNTSFTNPNDGTTRAVQVNRLAGSLPSIFDYVLFSGGDLTK